MPYAFEQKKQKIPRDLDLRIKLTETDKQKIRDNYGKISQRKLAELFEVSRRTIQFIGDPEKHKRNLLLRKLRGGSKAYYDKDKHKEYIKKYRKRKQQLKLKGKLEETKKCQKTK